MLTDKIILLPELLKIISLPEERRQRIVFTNGCFDILHAGHVLYLEKAKELGDILVIGLNSDDSVRRLKGEKRPLNNQQDRAIVLAGLSSVDYVIVFNEDTPYNLIKAVRPDILTKGGDWAKEDIVGSDIVLTDGGEVISLPYWQGLSSTNIINRIDEGLSYD